MRPLPPSRPLALLLRRRALVLPALALPALLLPALALGGLSLLGLSACDQEARARRAARSRPLDRFALPVARHVPARVFTSRRGAQPVGRPQPVFIEVQMRTGVLSIATEVLGVGGVRVVGGGRLNHGSAGRTRTLERSITAELRPESDGSLLVGIDWRMRVDAPEQHTQVTIPMPALRPAPTPR